MKYSLCVVIKKLHLSLLKILRPVQISEFIENHFKKVFWIFLLFHLIYLANSIGHPGESFVNQPILQADYAIHFTNSLEAESFFSSPSENLGI